MNRTRRDEQGGFTLLEVLVALTLGALALTMVFRTGAVSIDATSRSDNKMHATLHARSLLAELGTSRPITEGESWGRLDPTTTWHLLASLRESPTALIRAFDLELTVTKEDEVVILESTRLIPVRNTQ